MKVLLPRLTAVLLLFFFLIGFVNVADAAYAGKKSTTTETVVSADTATIATQTPPRTTPAADTATILLVILSFILPPLAVYLKYEEVGTPFWVNVLLTVLFWVPGVIHALYHVLVK
ncbi:MAG: YqaE/Pmp3 family membrane protein [Chloroflexota bacterium]|nr:YqaE/Pmp3 family membrane protein [Lentimicrobium sp.]